MDLQDIHPLKRLTKSKHILPILSKCQKEPKPSFESQLKLALLNELDLPAPENSGEIAKDPFLLLGYGINAYFSLMTSIAKLFLVLTVLSLPLLIYYANNEVKALSDFPFYPIKQFSLGNLGGSSVTCIH